MKLAAALLPYLLVLPCVAQVQSTHLSRDNPLVADLPYFVTSPQPDSTLTGTLLRANGQNAANGGNRDRFKLNQSFAARPNAAAPTYSGGARQTFYFYFPHYAGRSRIGVTSRSKPALAPRPVTPTPFSDPFYEEKALHLRLGDETPFYP
jgi:hypothetical protein